MTFKSWCSRSLAERGSKLRGGGRMRGHTGVAPSRERGSKPPAVSLCNDHRRSLAGARIETQRTTAMPQYPYVAPSRERGSNPSISRCEPSSSCRSLAGARIETSRAGASASTSAVAPSRERGSKLQLFDQRLVVETSLPRGSADRNRRHDRTSRKLGVAPSRERGSKLLYPAHYELTGYVQGLSARERMRPVSARRRFQALQQASTMAASSVSRQPDK